MQARLRGLGGLECIRFLFPHTHRTNHWAMIVTLRCIYSNTCLESSVPNSGCQNPFCHNICETRRDHCPHVAANVVPVKPNILLERANGFSSCHCGMKVRSLVGEHFHTFCVHLIVASTLCGCPRVPTQITYVWHSLCMFGHACVINKQHKPQSHCRPLNIHGRL